MDAENIYAASNIAVLPAWALLIFAPRWKWTEILVHRIWVPGLFCLLWIGIFIFRPASAEGAGIGSLDQFMIFMSGDYDALMIWVQLVVWDLFVGIWIARDAIGKNIHHAWVVPSLLLTLTYPPIGLMAYLLIRFVYSKDLALYKPLSQ